MGKRIQAALLLAALLITEICFGVFPAWAGEAPTNGAVTAYYFHGSFRCPTCKKLEKYAKETIESNYQDALASGKLAFKVVNVENKGNEHFMTDYQLYTRSLVLSLTKNGKEIRSKNLDKIWEYVGNKGQYEGYVRDEVAAFLKEA